MDSGLVSLRSRPGMTHSKHLEILALFPVRDVGLKTLDLGVLDVDVVIDEFRAQAVAEKRIVLQRRYRLAQGFWQQRRGGLVRRIRRRPGIEGAIDAVEAGENLRGHV